MLISEALLECLPPAAYDRSAPTVVREVNAAAAVLGDANDNVDALRLEQDPTTALVSMPDWERNYNLPDACAGGASASLDVRRANLMVRIKARGNMSRPYLIELAATMGFPGATITEYGPFTCDSPCDAALNDMDWVGIWCLNVLQPTTLSYMTCESPCDSPLVTWGSKQLECMVNRRKPAHTKAVFRYPL